MLGSWPSHLPPNQRRKMWVKSSVQRCSMFHYSRWRRSALGVADLRDGRDEQVAFFVLQTHFDGALATVAGRRVTLAGPFPPGSTLVQFGYSLPIRGPTLSFDQKLPVALAQFSMMAQKVGAMSVQSPQIAEHRDMPVQGQIFIVGKGPAVPALGTISLAFSGLPHQPLWPRNVALGVAVVILLGGLWATLRPRSRTGDETARRRRLEAKRDRLFAELVATEEEHRAGNTDAGRYTARRRELVSALERLYAELDEEAAA